MLDDNFISVYDKFKLHFYRQVFELVRERDGSLSAMEAFSLEVINMLDKPTVGQFAEFLNISQSNATYKVNNLIKKGYLERQKDSADRRAVRIVPTEKGRQANAHHAQFHREMVDQGLATLTDDQADALVIALEGLTRFFRDKYQQ